MWKMTRLQFCNFTSANRCYFKNFTALFTSMEHGAERLFCRISKRCVISWITGLNVQRLQILQFFHNNYQVSLMRNRASSCGVELSNPNVAEKPTKQGAVGHQLVMTLPKAPLRFIFSVIILHQVLSILLTLEALTLPGTGTARGFLSLKFVIMSAIISSVFPSPISSARIPVNTRQQSIQCTGIFIELSL